MGWAEKRIAEYRKGAKATWLERLALEHANPVNCAAHIAATAAFVWGLWAHELIWILAAILIAILGHLYVWLK